MRGTLGSARLLMPPAVLICIGLMNLFESDNNITWAEGVIQWEHKRTFFVQNIGT